MVFENEIYVYVYINLMLKNYYFFMVFICSIFYEKGIERFIDRFI